METAQRRQTISKLSRIPGYSGGGFIDGLKKAVGMAPPETMIQKFARQDAERAAKQKPVAQPTEQAQPPKPDNAIGNYVGNTALQAREKAAGLAGGGPVEGEGGPTEDNIPIKASVGEFMIRAAAVKEIGLPALRVINKLGGNLPKSPNRKDNKFEEGGPIKKPLSADMQAVADAEAKAAKQLKKAPLKATTSLGAAERNNLIKYTPNAPVAPDLTTSPGAGVPKPVAAQVGPAIHAGDVGPTAISQPATPSAAVTARNALAATTPPVAPAAAPPVAPAAAQMAQVPKTIIPKAPIAPAIPSGVSPLPQPMVNPAGVAPPPIAPAAPPVPPAGAVPPTATPKTAAEKLFGTAADWQAAGQGATGKVGAAWDATKGALKKVGKVAKFAAAPLGVAEAVDGIASNDGWKTAKGVGDAVAGAALFTPAAPAAGVYFAMRGANDIGGWAAKKMADMAMSGRDAEMAKATQPTMPTEKPVVPAAAPVSAAPVAQDFSAANAAKIAANTAQQVPLPKPGDVNNLGPDGRLLPDGQQNQFNGREWAVVSTPEAKAAKAVSDTAYNARMDGENAAINARMQAEYARVLAKPSQYEQEVASAQAFNEGQRQYHLQHDAANGNSSQRKAALAALANINASSMNKANNAVAARGQDIGLTQHQMTDATAQRGQNINQNVTSRGQDLAANAASASQRLARDQFGLSQAKDGRESAASAMDIKARQQLMDAQQEDFDAGDDPVKQKAAARKLSALGVKQPNDKGQVISLPDTTGDMGQVIRGGQAVLMPDGSLIRPEQAGANPKGPAGAHAPTSKAEYDKLPKGSKYTHPDGTTRTKG